MDNFDVKKKKEKSKHLHWSIQMAEIIKLLLFVFCFLSLSDEKNQQNAYRFADKTTAFIFI